MGVKAREKVKGSGEWWVFIDHQGKRRAKKIGQDKKLALEVAAKINARLVLGELDLDEPAKKKAPAFGDYAEQFMETYSKLHHKPTTHRSYRNMLKAHILPVFGRMAIDEITRQEVKAFIIQKQKEGFSRNTVRLLRAYMSGIFTQAVDDELLAANPTAKTGRYIKKDKGKSSVRPFSMAEKECFEREVQERFPHYYALFLCALRTGMREGELIALKPGDVSFQGGFIEVRRNCVEGRISTPKSGRTRRVEMSTQLRTVLKEHMTWRKENTLQRGWGEPPEWLFFNEKGGMLDPANFRKRVFYKCLERAGLRRITFHQLRHTYATLRIQAGHNIAEVSRQLGHSSIRVTIDTYYHYIPNEATSRVDDLDTESATKRNLSATRNQKGLAASG